VVAVDHRQGIVDLDERFHARRNRRARRIAGKLADVDRRARAFGQAPELREASRHLLEAMGFDAQHLHRFRQLRRRVTPKSIHREADRGERVFQFVRKLPGALAERAGAFRLELARARRFELAGHVAHASSKDLELRCAAPGRRHGKRLSSANPLRPPDQLLQRPAQIPAQVTGNSRRDDSDDQHRRQRRQSEDLRALSQHEIGLP
jgi:hypothetical protein